MCQDKICASRRAIAAAAGAAERSGTSNFGEWDLYDYGDSKNLIASKTAAAYSREAGAAIAHWGDNAKNWSLRNIYYQKVLT